AIDSSEGLGFQLGPILDLRQNLQSIPYEQNRILNPGSLDRGVPGKRLVLVDGFCGSGECKPVALLIADRSSLRMPPPFIGISGRGIVRDRALKNRCGARAWNG